MKVNQSIEGLNKLVDCINNSCQQANQKLQAEIEIRNETVEAIRGLYQHAYQQIKAQLHLEKLSFSDLKQIYEEVENKTNSTTLKEQFEQENIIPVKEKDIKDYEQELSKYYDLSNKKDKIYYQKTIDSYRKRMMQAKTPFDCSKNLQVLKECQRLLQISDEDEYIKNNEDIKKAQAILIKQNEEIEASLKQSLQFSNNEVKGLTIGKMFVENEYLKHWNYQDIILEMLNGKCENNCLKVPFNDELNDYVIVAGKKGQGMIQLLEFSTMLDSLKEPVHIYYDYPTMTSLFTVPGYDNCQRVTINDDFVLQLQQEITNCPNQMISIFIENGNNLPTSFKRFIQDKPDYVQIVINNPSPEDIKLYDNFIRLKYYHPQNGLECFIVNGKYDLYLNQINEKGFNRLQTSRPMPIVKMNNFETYYQDNINQNKYLINSDYSLSFDDNLIIVSKDATKRTRYLAQLLLPRLNKPETKYVYYEDFSDTTLRRIIDQNNFEEIMPDMIDSMMNDFLQDNSLVILADPIPDALDLVETVLAMGHIIIINDEVIDGYKNLIIDDNIIEENGVKEKVVFEMLSDESLNKLL